MPEVKLTYFNVKAIGEPIRMILKYSGKDFIDERIDIKDWPALKPKTPFGKLPILEIDGKVLHQSAVICKYLGEQAGLCGTNNWENIQIEMIADTVKDLKNIMSHFHRQLDDAAKEKARPALLTETIPFYLERFDKIIKENGGYFVSGKLSWVDFYFIGYSETMEGMLNEKVCEKYPHISALRKKLYSLPEIKEWILKRPEALL